MDGGQGAQPQRLSSWKGCKGTGCREDRRKTSTWQVEAAALDGWLLAGQERILSG